jgi:taurine dioxygenase
MCEAKFATKPLTLSFGAEIQGLNLGDADDQTVGKLESLLLQHRVLILRGQSLTDEQLVAVSAKLGQLDIPAPNPYGEPFHKAHPEINVISNIVENDKPAGNLGSGEAVWHADMTYLDTPPRAAILYSLEVPAEGGNTYFADMHAAFATLPEDIKSQLDGKVAIHDASHNSAGIRRKGYEEVTDIRQTPGARHPLVRVDVKTGREALFLGRRPRSYICGMSVAESDALLDKLWAHAEKPEFAISHQWRPGDVLMWSNLEVLHRRDSFDTTTRRKMHRTQIRSFWSETEPVESAD